MTRQQVIVLSFISLMLTSTNIYNDSVTADIPKLEEGYPRLRRVVCTDSGLCLIFYSRIVQEGDLGYENGPYVKAAYITAAGKITELGSSIPLSMNVNASYNIIRNYMYIHEVQEEEDIFHLIGFDPDGILYEIWYFKNNNTVYVKEKNYGLNGLYGYITHDQWSHTTQIRNYSLIRLDWTDFSDEKFVIMSKANLEGVEEISLPLYWGQRPGKYMFDGNNSFFLFYYDGYHPSQTIKLRHSLDIKRIFLNGTWYDYLSGFQLVPTNRRRGYLFRGADDGLYLGIRGNDPQWEDYTRTRYNHTFYLVNIATKQIITHSFTSPEQIYEWDVLIDSESYFHVLLHSYYKTQYLKFTPNGSISFDTTLAFPQTGDSYIRPNTFALYQNKYLVGGLRQKNDDIGLFVSALETGEVVSINTSLIPYIGDRQNLFTPFAFSPLTSISLVIILVKIRKKENSP